MRLPAPSRSLPRHPIRVRLLRPSCSECAGKSRERADAGEALGRGKRSSSTDANAGGAAVAPLRGCSLISSASGTSLHIGLHTVCSIV